MMSTGNEAATMKALRWILLGLFVVLLSVMSGVVGFVVGGGGEDGGGAGGVGLFGSMSETF